MDQDAFRETYREINEVYCAFEKSILTNECRCSCAERFCIAEREGVHCKDEVSQSRCLQWLALLRQQARFAVRGNEERHLLPHGKAIRLQVGGMRGLGAILNADIETVDDINHALHQAEVEFDTLAEIPFSEVMREVVAYRVRKRSRRRQ